MLNFWIQIMQKHWDKLWEKIVETDKQFDEYLQNAGLGTLGIKKTKGVVKAWNDLKKLAEEFDQFVTPVDPVTNILPWETSKFVGKWKFWKEYLQEQHGQVMRSRSEKMALEYLAMLAGDNEERACQIIDFSCYLRAKSFIIPPEKKEDNNKLAKTVEDGTW
mgnify:CR=1 FL=1